MKMKTSPILQILLGFFAIASPCLATEDGKILFPNCPDFKIVYPELRDKVDLEHVLGPWNMIRHNCPDPDRAKYVDCIRELYFIDDKTPPSSVNWVMQMRINHTEHKTASGVLGFKGLDGDKIDNFFEHSFNDPESNVTMAGQSALIDTDDGDSWSLWASCVDMGPTKKFVDWTIFSRYAWMDARLEQDLVERIEKYGGVGPKELRGIGQTGCFKHPAHS